MKKILCLLVAVAVIFPVMAQGKKGIKGKIVSITAEQLVVTVKKEEKTFTITEEAKIFNAAGEEKKAKKAEKSDTE